MVKKDDLVAFLKARLDEDENAARQGAQLHDDEPPDPSYAGGVADLEAAGWEPVAARRLNEYLAYFEPARMLREVAAKRRILHEHNPAAWANTNQNRYCPSCAEDTHASTPHPPYERVHAPCTTVKLLALPYSDHRDYQEGWKP